MQVGALLLKQAGAAGAAGSIIYFGLMFLLFVAFFLCCLTTSPSLCRKRWVSTLNYKPQFSLAHCIRVFSGNKSKLSQHCVAVLIKNNSDWTTCVAECCFSGTSKFLTSCCLVSICHVTPAFIMLLSLPFEGGAQLISANFYRMRASHCAGCWHVQGWLRASIQRGKLG